jgi:hypothetical protein
LETYSCEKEFYEKYGELPDYMYDVIAASGWTEEQVLKLIGVKNGRKAEEE